MKFPIKFPFKLPMKLQISALKAPTTTHEMTDSTADPMPHSHTEDEINTDFPLHCLPSAAGEMAREIGRVTTAQNEALAAASVIALVSASIGAGLAVNTGGERTTRGNLYLLAIAESGTGKGEAYKLAALPFEQMETEAHDQFNQHTKPGLLADLTVAELRCKKLSAKAAGEMDVSLRAIQLLEYRDAETERAQIQKRIDAAPRWKVADVTKEALAVVMAGQTGEAVASLSSEARGILSIVKGRYGKEGGDEDLYCAAYSGDSISVDRVGREQVNLRNPCLSILWMVQPDAARHALHTEGFVDSGFLPRFLVFDPQAEPQERDEQPAPIPFAVKNAWAQLIRTLVDTYRMNGHAPQTISLSPAATQRLIAYEKENVRRRRKAGDLHDLAPFVARWTENAWRLALVLHAAEFSDKAHETQLEDHTAVHAIGIMRWFCARQLDLLTASRREKQGNRLLALLAVLAAAESEMTLRVLKRSYSFEPDEVERLCNIFPDRLTIEKTQGSIGRPSMVVKAL